MITLKEACKKILEARPNQYIHGVNEYKNAFEFIMVPNGYTREDLGGTLCTDAVDKKDGLVWETLLGDKDFFEGDYYKQYTAEDLEKLL